MGDSIGPSSPNFENAQHYTMKSWTFNDHAGNSSALNASSRGTDQGPIGPPFYGAPGGGSWQAGMIGGPPTLYGQLDGQFPHDAANSRSGVSGSQQDMRDMHSAGYGYQQTQPYPNGAYVLGSQSYHGTSSNRKHVLIGGNGQISPVSHNSLNNFTDNDHKFSFGSYAPSHISSYGAPGPALAGQQRGQLQMEIGQIRMSLLNFAGN